MRKRGSIRARGHHFEIRLDLGLVDGKRQRRSIAFKGTYRGAQREMTRLLKAADDGTLQDPSAVTVAEYVRGFLDSSVTQSPKTLERYRELAERQVIPHLGGVKLQHLRPEHLERWHSELLESGLAARTIGHAHRVLGLVLKRAVQNNTISRNVAAIRRPPKVDDVESRSCSPSPSRPSWRAWPAIRCTRSPSSRSAAECVAAKSAACDGRTSISIAVWSVSRDPSRRRKQGSG